MNRRILPLKKMSIEELIANPYLLFSPVLLLLIIFTIIQPTTATFGDESRYLSFASNLLSGFFSPPAPNIDLGNGPGYPILLIPFVALKLPLITITLFNALLFYFSIILLFKTIRRIAPLNISIAVCMFWAFYLNAWENIPLVLSETFSVFLICFILFHFSRALESDSISSGKYRILLSGLSLGYLVLTKPIFGYVLPGILAGSVILLLTNSKSLKNRINILIFAIGLLTITPYLLYTYHLTGRFYYLSSFGGDNLYWMSSPDKNEYGSWYPYNPFTADTVSALNTVHPDYITFNRNHHEDLKVILKYKGIERDDAYKKIALENIINHPAKFALNCLCNAGRMLFNFPYSYKLQSPNTLARLPFNGLIVVFVLFSAIPTLLNWRQLPFSMRILISFSLLYFGGSLFGSAEIRMFTIIVPILLLWISYILHKTVKLDFHF